MRTCLNCQGSDLERTSQGYDVCRNCSFVNSPKEAIMNRTATRNQTDAEILAALGITGSDVFIDRTDPYAFVAVRAIDGGRDEKVIGRVMLGNTGWTLGCRDCDNDKEILLNGLCTACRTLTEVFDDISGATPLTYEQFDVAINDDTNQALDMYSYTTPVTENRKGIVAIYRATIEGRKYTLRYILTPDFKVRRYACQFNNYPGGESFDIAWTSVAVSDPASRLVTDDATLDLAYAMNSF